MSLNITPNYESNRVAKHFDDLGVREWNRLPETPVDEVSLYLDTLLTMPQPSGSMRSLALVLKVRWLILLFEMGNMWIPT